MEIVVKALYKAAFAIWNFLMETAMTLFTTSPTSAAGGTPYATVHQEWLILILRYSCIRVTVLRWRKCAAV